ncbi:MAG: TetR/AcrR family transcriptional regulator [Mycobacterium sp.]
MSKPGEASAAGRQVEAQRTRSPRGQGRQLRAELMQAVGELLDERLRSPDLNLSLREVARHTGIATQSVYLHFPSKESLAYAVAEEGYRELVKQMQNADADGGSAADRLRAQAHAFIRFAQANRGVFRLMFGQDVSQLDPKQPAHPGEQLWLQWVSVMRDCETDGRSWPSGAEVAAQDLWSALLGRFVLWSTTFARDTETDIAIFADHVVDRQLIELDSPERGSAT